MDYTKVLQELQEYFANLIILQYRYAPENRALIKNLVNLIFANNLALQIRDLTVDVEKSIGAQLDVVGKWVGLDRFYNGIDDWDHPYLSYPYFTTIANNSYDRYQGGFSTYSNFADNNGGFLMYKDWKEVRSRINIMSDDMFRLLIKLKIIKNSINHTCKNIDNAIWEWSQGNVYTTWGTMAVTYHYKPSYKTAIVLATYKNIIPRPTGCTMKFEENTNDD